MQLGGRASKLLGDAGGFAVIPEVRGWWFGETLGGDAAAPVRFAAAPTLPAFGSGESRGGTALLDQLVLGSGLTFLAGERARVYAHYDLLLGDGTAHAGTFGGELRW